jgi:hypothetical protein
MLRLWKDARENSYPFNQQSLRFQTFWLSVFGGRDSALISVSILLPF